MLTAGTEKLPAGAVSYFEYNAAEAGYTSDRCSLMTPRVYIFAGNKTQEEAEQLVAELGAEEKVQEYAGSIYVVNPISGDAYGEADAEAFPDLVQAKSRITAIKVVGIDEGATFVNNHIAQNAFFISGMMLYGGEMDEGLEPTVEVPVWLSGGSETALAYYEKANAENILAVIAEGDQENLADAFSDAWNKVLGRYYRFCNTEKEWYEVNLHEQTASYELNEIPDFEELGLDYQIHRDEAVAGMPGKYTWYTCVPESVRKAEEGTVPLVLSCHGNGNDPRIQIDTTGWAEAAAEEGFILVSPEWQEAEKNATGCDGLGEDGVLALIETLKTEYPQINPQRIYISGLSAGGAFTMMMGIRHNDVFAAVAPVSAPYLHVEEIESALENYEGCGVPMIALYGDHDVYQFIPVDGSSPYGQAGMWAEQERFHIFPAIQNYQKVLGLEVSEKPDMTQNPYYGIALDNQKMVELGYKHLYTGTLSNDEGIVMELGAVLNQPHWNYKPQAEYIWQFFERYARDTENRAIIWR